MQSSGGSETHTPIVVLASNYRQFQLYCHQQGIPHTGTTYLSPNDDRGIRGWRYGIFVVLNYIGPRSGLDRFNQMVYRMKVIEAIGDVAVIHATT